MNIQEYFTVNNGTGVLSTADSLGRVNAAIYAKPHTFGENRVSFIMRDRLSKANLDKNPSAHYLFMENSKRTTGIRMSLEKVAETTDETLISTFSRHSETADEQRFLVTFRILKVLKLIGGEEINIS